jgi:hypothetical protein
MIDHPERLRELASSCAQMTQGETDPLIQQIARADTLMLRGAADEIEKLREALLEIAEFNSVGGDAAYMMDVARRALGEAKDE